MNPVYVLTKPRHAKLVRSVIPQAKLTSSLDELREGECLIAYSIGIVVPASVLARYSRAYNFHGASPAFPGRDPHHWACYYGAEAYGSTAHEMQPEVDSGKIVAAFMRGVIPTQPPSEYRRIGEHSLELLFTLVAPAMTTSELPAIDVNWSGTRRTRADLLKMCDLRDLTPDEVSRRRAAFAGFEHAFKEP